VGRMKTSVMVDRGLWERGVGSKPPNPTSKGGRIWERRRELFRSETLYLLGGKRGG